jgi:hypothetical protein
MHSFLKDLPSPIRISLEGNCVEDGWVVELELVNQPSLAFSDFGHEPKGLRGREPLHGCIRAAVFIY